MCAPIMAAMSGGVDSAAAAAILAEKGSVIGATLQLWQDERTPDLPDPNVTDARAVCDSLGISHRVIDLRETFRRTVIADFAAAYERGETPNPCIVCNRLIKFGRLLEEAEAAGCAALATGHYVRREASNGRILLRRAADAAKDQTYVLYSLTQAQLARIRFPLGELTKAEARDIVRAAGLNLAEKKESQDICFVPDGDYAGFLERLRGAPYPPGDFLTPDGRVLGRHRGLVRYTVGQRKGLGLALPAPLYVCAKCPGDNSVILADNASLFTRTLTAREINFIPFDRLDRPMRLLAKVRYAQSAQWATVEQTDDNSLRVEFDQPQRAIAPGQSVVFYEDDYLVGGGIICGG